MSQHSNHQQAILYLTQGRRPAIVCPEYTCVMGAKESKNFCIFSKGNLGVEEFWVFGLKGLSTGGYVGGFIGLEFGNIVTQDDYDTVMRLNTEGESCMKEVMPVLTRLWREYLRRRSAVVEHCYRVVNFNSSDFSDRDIMIMKKLGFRSNPNCYYRNRHYCLNCTPLNVSEELKCWPVEQEIGMMVYSQIKTLLAGGKILA